MPKEITIKKLDDLIFKAWQSNTKQYNKISKLHDPSYKETAFEIRGLMDAYEAVLYALRENSSILLERSAGHVNVMDYEIDKETLIDLINDARFFCSRKIKEAEDIYPSYFQGSIKAYNSVFSALCENDIKPLLKEVHNES